MGLKSETFNAVRWTAIAMMCRAGLQFAQIAVLARMLAPSDFGLMAVVMSVMAFMYVFTDLGVSAGIIHYQNVTHEQLSSLYWLSVLAGLGLMFLMVAMSAIVSDHVFGQPALRPIMMIISVNFLFMAAGQQVRVMAEKEMQFSVLTKVEVAAALGGFITAITWAWYSPSVYALVAGTLVSGFAQAVLLWLFVSKGWKPKCRLRLNEISHFLKFGLYVMANNCVNNFNSQADVLIGGRVFPAATLGIYSLPRNLSLNVSQVVNPIVTRVGLPVMAKAQLDRDVLKSVYLKTMQMTASINFPVYVALAVFSREVVMVVFGEKWIGSAPLLVYLAMWGMFRSCGNPVGSLLLAVGRADQSFKWNMALLFVVAPTLWLASQFGVLGLALGQASLMAVLLIPSWYYLVRPHCEARLGEYLLCLLRPLVAALLAVIVGYLMISELNNSLWRLVGAASVAVPLYLVVSWLINRSWLMAMRELFVRTSDTTEVKS